MDKSQGKLIRVQIIQRLIPAYRVSLFQSLEEQKDLYVKVCASRRVPGIANFSSVDTDEEYADLKHPWYRSLGKSPALAAQIAD